MGKSNLYEFFGMEIFVEVYFFKSFRLMDILFFSEGEDSSLEEEEDIFYLRLRFLFVGLESIF